jgi:hypothetical protein
LHKDFVFTLFMWTAPRKSFNRLSLNDLLHRKEERSRVAIGGTQAGLDER